MPVVVRRVSPSGREGGYEVPRSSLASGAAADYKAGSQLPSAATVDWSLAWRSQRAACNGRVEFTGWVRKRGSIRWRGLFLSFRLGARCSGSARLPPCQMTAWGARRCLFRSVVRFLGPSFLCAEFLRSKTDGRMRIVPHVPCVQGRATNGPAQARRGHAVGRPARSAQTLHRGSAVSRAQARWRRRGDGAQSGVSSRLFSLHQAQHGLRAWARRPWIVAAEFPAAWLIL